jgi:uroporphyrin-III C-methyltransferase/precorrin-2 dehydrogenase/sirohydrochlorin ferrochelatase
LAGFFVFGASFWRRRNVMEADPSLKVLVSLVGAGPGDSDLWTLRAVHRLEKADLVLRDSTVKARDVRRYTRAAIIRVTGLAESGSVGRQGVQRRMIRAARAGKRVVRLFSCETFVFGCSEEALALRAAGIPFEVVPGISSAIAAPELAGIPLTHRGVASGFVVLSDPSPGSLPQVLRGTQPKRLSMVVQGDVSGGPEIAQVLIGFGWSSTTPAAVVCDASAADRRIWTGALADLLAFEAAAGERGVIVVGEVVRVRDVLMKSVARVPNFEVQYGRH